jgi:NlpC/P60 family putative phage cell wall peptidase
MMTTRMDIVRAARAWLGTPYRHQAAMRGAGCDCLGLVRGVWRDLYGVEAEEPHAYSPDWGESGAVEILRDAAARHLDEIPLGAARPGDVLLFRMTPGRIAKHLAIMSVEGKMIHAYSGDAVREIAYTPAWSRKAVAAFCFPGVA